MILWMFPLHNNLGFSQNCPNQTDLHSLIHPFQWRNIAGFIRIDLLFTTLLYILGSNIPLIAQYGPLFAQNNRVSKQATRSLTPLVRWHPSLCSLAPQLRSALRHYMCLARFLHTQTKIELYDNNSENKTNPGWNYIRAGLEPVRQAEL